MAAERVQRALELLQEAGHMDPILGGALKNLRPARKVSGGVSAAMWACLPPQQAQSAGAQTRQEHLDLAFIGRACGALEEEWPAEWKNG
ncbi:hypothetical protein NDU88_002380 [Pleurodeles waltl]|uniref:Uncharacterized protein n=1 Tax=Pleurodeles waltl TaxID=8319 RepID=A0AAV7UCZ9_PLEWA|nr:hypothetical protein NDU88_002380 [Pleurodeles waltl]